MIKKLLLGLLVSAYATTLSAQSPVVPSRDVPPVAGSSEEDDVLLLQLLGRMPGITSAVRPFTANELDVLTPGPRASRSFQLVRPTATLWFNSTRPYSENDGVVWTGRGLTGSISGGFAARAGWLSLVARPVAFWTENLPFTRPRSDAAPGQFQDPYAPTGIDQPYRFGNRAYARLDPGESTLQLETPFVALGVSTATQTWGPMHEYPLVLGNNAGGFPNGFIRTSRPIPLYIGTLSAKAIVGRLERSAFAPTRTGDARRVASGMVAEFSPAFVPGLELGATRFFHRKWPEGGLALQDFTDLFQSFLKSSLSSRPGYKEGDDNQLASVFFRVVAPPSGFELYGEYLREDHSQDIRDLIGEPDHSAAWALGLRHVWLNDAAHSTSMVTIEGVDAVISKLIRFRGEGVMYTHDAISEGHTYLGQILGSPAAYGGRGFDIDFRRRFPENGWSVRVGLEQVAQNLEGGNFNGQYLGFYRFGGTRSRRIKAWQIDAGLDGYLSWQARTPGNNVRATFAIRPY